MTRNVPVLLARVVEDAHLLKEVSADIWSVSGALTEDIAQYDSIGGAYDLVGSLGIYHRLCWGVSTNAYREFVEQARLACDGGQVLDAGCGSMLFSAASHRRPNKGVVIGADVSRAMLTRARNRLGGDGHPGNVVLLQADILHSPFRCAVFDVIICLHVAHVLQDLEGLIGELQRILRPGGRLFLTSVVLVNGWRDRYLRALSQRGILASPRHPENVVAAVRKVFGVEPNCRLAGSMLFTEAQSS
ncbi:MAG TPA: class I SAM-dependent methyltransferase [Bryobacteraceae bacterium]|nr:class I SAM-dependent methyltransferase [Bryobacteraceae bacterium]